MKNIDVKFQNGKTLLDINLTFKQHLFNTLYKLRLAISLFVILLGFIILMIYYYGSITREYHRHPLYEIFHDEKNQNLTRLLNQKDSSKIMIKGNYNDGLKIYLGHFANQLIQSNENVIIHNVEDENMPIQPFVSTIFHWLQNWMGYASVKSTTRIIILHNQISNSKIQQIIQSYPNDRFIIAQSKKLQNQQKLNDFQEVQFQNFDQNLLIESLIGALKISRQQAKALKRHYQDIQKIFQLIQSNQFVDDNALISTVLQGKYHSIKQLSQKNKKVLQKLCKNGTMIIKIFNDKLIDFGVKFVEDNIYWENELVMLNYQLKNHIMCQLSGLHSENLSKKQQEDQRDNTKQNTAKVDQA